MGVKALFELFPMPLQNRLQVCEGAFTGQLPSLNVCLLASWSPIFVPSLVSFLFCQIKFNEKEWDPQHSTAMATALREQEEYQRNSDEQLVGRCVLFHCQSSSTLF